jgi:hypothetical protein
MIEYDSRTCPRACWTSMAGKSYGGRLVVVGRASAFILLLNVMFAQALHANNIPGDWEHNRDDPSGDHVISMELRLYPQAAPDPALSVRLIPDEYDRRDGNAAVYYLKAMGFLEQNPARNALEEFQGEARKKAQESGRGNDEFPPHSWLTMPVGELPVDEVREYLRLSDFQTSILHDAAHQRHFSMDRHIRDVENPYGYLISEIQTMRELARKQSIRCRLAIAEGDWDRAIEILGQQYALASHLGQDDFLISALVGNAISSIATTDALLLTQSKGAPNLYWALADLPNPLTDLRGVYALEREMVFQQMRMLKEVDETPRPAGYWQDFIDRLIPSAEGLEVYGLEHIGGLSESLKRAQVINFIAVAYPQAKAYLIDECGLDRELVEEYPTAQVVFLASVRFYHQAADERSKWCAVPIWQAQQSEAYQRRDEKYQQQMKNIGLAGTMAGRLLPAFDAAHVAHNRQEQQLALLQAFEAIRLHAAEDGELPASLSHLDYPAPVDPFSGDAFRYDRKGRRAVLEGHRAGGVRYRLILNLVGD